MPVFQLTSEIAFPPVHLARHDGLLALGGDLSQARLLEAYARGIFPWFSDGEPILWWSPDPRCILLPNELYISRRLARKLKQGLFEITVDRCFATVVRACAHTRGPGRQSTWITEDMRRAYAELHRNGFAHSVEAWADGELAGGLYGVSLGGCFFGESMFSRIPDASKAALTALVERLRAWGFPLVDCQVSNPHLLRLGARNVPRNHFLDRLEDALAHPTRRGSWDESA